MFIEQTVSSVSSISLSTIDSHSLPLADRLSSPHFPSSTISTPSWTTTEFPALVPIHVSTIVSSIVSIDIPVYAYQL